ncbi:hypothetical protein RN001_002629 [Aquatica leii]|uniref:Uncharacterized protein n=1 Tax=Aquatica leii TaxID=1421715 RepID=A0AAN7PHG7_9COLE|nr:hypothetical protein RN001_002629 [Aquatica leii]
MAFQYSLWILTVTITSVLSAYKPINFVSKEPQRDTRSISSFSTLTVHPLQTPYLNNFPTDSFQAIGSPYADGEYWNNRLYASNPFNGLIVEINPDGHVTPDYSDGLAYPDSYLITGPTAKKVAKLLYSRELFYSNYPHISALLRNQQIRRENGLEENRLGSLRRGSPFVHFRHQYVYLP